MFVIYSGQTPIFKGECKEDMAKLCKELNDNFGRKYTISDEKPKPRNS